MRRRTDANCSLVSFTATNVTCRCSVLLLAAEDRAVSGSSRHLSSSPSSSSGLESSGVIEMVSMSEYTYEGFISTNSEIDDITVGDLRDGTLILSMFGVFWLLALACMLGLNCDLGCADTAAEKVQPADQGAAGEAERRGGLQSRSSIGTGQTNGGDKKGRLLG